MKTQYGEKFLVIDDDGGWVEASSVSLPNNFKASNHGLNNAKVFKSAEDAANFARRWNGHPWWCKPNGNFEVIEVVPVFRQVKNGYAVIEESRVTL